MKPKSLIPHDRGIFCPKCGAGTYVYDSRPIADGIRRRRLCSKCQFVFVTWEIMCSVPPIPKDELKRVTEMLRDIADQIENELK